MMNEVLWNEIDNCCLVYLDEVLISSSSRDTNFREVNLVCFCMTAARVRLNLVKCRIEQLEMQQMGHVITREIIRLSTAKCVVAKTTQHEKNDELG